MKYHATKQLPKKNQKPKPWEGKHALYYEAIFQLRDIETEQADYAIKLLNKEQIPIPKVITLKNGLDLYTADFKTTKDVAKALQRKYGGINQITARLFSEKDGKSVYRMTVLYRATPYKKGDTVLYRGEPFEIKQLQEKIVLQNNKTGKKVQLKCNEKDLALIKQIID